jgi:O-antigen ligase
MISSISHSETYKQYLFIAFSCLLFGTIVLAEHSPALLSISMMGQLFSIILFTKPKNLIQNFIQNKPLLYFSFGYLMLLFSFFYSENTSYLWERLQIKIPLLLYPIVLPSLPALSGKQLRIIFYAYISSVVLTSAGILGNYALNYEYYNQLYLEAKVMPGPIHHIRWSLLVVFASYLTFYHFRYYTTRTSEKYLLAFVFIFLSIFIHIYSVRSGIVCFYCAIILAIINYVMKTRNFKYTLIGISVLILIGVLSLFLSPTLNNKILNTQKDYTGLTNNQNPNHNTLSTRIISMQIGFDIYKENKLFGCGQGDIKDKTDVLFYEKHPSITTPILPHNQFVYYLAATGIIGLIIFLISFTAPLWSNGNYTHELIQAAYLILLIAFQFEPMLETQIGVATTLIMLLIVFVYLKPLRFNSIN